MKLLDFDNILEMLNIYTGPMKHKLLLLFVFGFVAVAMNSPLSPPKQSGDAWTAMLQTRLRESSNQPERNRIENLSNLGPHRRLRISVPSHLRSTGEAVHQVLFELNLFWKNHPEVGRIQATLHFLNPAYEMPDVQVFGRRDQDCISWVKDRADGSCLQKLIWIHGDSDTSQVLPARIRAENWNGQNDLIRVFHPKACSSWGNYGTHQEPSLESWLRKTQSVGSGEYGLWLFRDPDGPDFSMPLRLRSDRESQFCTWMWNFGAT
jgi:hypothetical protein